MRPVDGRSKQMSEDICDPNPKFYEEMNSINILII